MNQSHRATTLQQRIEIWERASSGETNSQIAVALQISKETVRKWRRKAQRGGRNGLVPTMGRPKSGNLGSFSAELRSGIREKRQAHPGWGPETLLKELENDLRFRD